MPILRSLAIAPIYVGTKIRASCFANRAGTLPPRGTDSSSSSLFDGHDHHDDHESTADHYKAAKKQGQSLVFFKRPMMRQYFHKGLLWRGQDSQEVASFELFVDLFYVGIIAIAGDAAAEDPHGESLLKFVIVFVLSWKVSIEN
jgi:hypothetical protein